MYNCTSRGHWRISLCGALVDGTPHQQSVPRQDLSNLPLFCMESGLIYLTSSLHGVSTYVMPQARLLDYYPSWKKTIAYVRFYSSYFMSKEVISKIAFRNQRAKKCTILLAKSHTFWKREILYLCINWSKQPYITSTLPMLRYGQLNYNNNAITILKH
jgi:hypothetical protein